MKQLQVIILSILISLSGIYAQENDEKDKKTTKLSTALNGFSFRNIGPAFMSGRIADIAIDPKNENTWYVAVGSGGVWKTSNAGTTWKPLTDSQPFYSTGAITLDPNATQTIWLGTGENVGGRHVGIGHGVYLSRDGGKSWESKGLKKSEHISKIIVHPDDSNTIWVASQGPLWSSGGERGLYKSTDGGATWKQTIALDEWTGVTDLVIDPRNPNILYAASWQRHRNVAAYMGGGPGTALYKSEDGGETWRKLKTGLPKVDMGKIGLAISPQNPDVLYTAIELERRKGAVYRSDNGGESWTKMSDTVSGGTGPHYYQELIASPHVFDKLFLMNNYVLVSEDGGKTFYQMNETKKHVDSHAMVFKANDPNYILVGTDGGLYETFDNTQNWKFVNNLPLTQFYKLAVDDAYPFYNIFGGTQDNNTQGGPSRTFNSNGISNADWFVLLGGDGHQPATEPGNPDIVYAQSQQGNLYRIDRTTDEAVYIRPQNGLDEPYERFNWDAPILVSQHDPKRLYFASQRVWRSENRGDSWSPISTDLTKNEERLVLPIMGRQQSWDAAWDVYAMSTYNTLTSLAESAQDEHVLYAGSDDGLLHLTKDGGDTWTLKTVDKLPGVPATAFVNDIKADLFDADVAYVTLDNHKYGDYAPYLYKTTTGGKTWKSISNGLPEGTLVWRLVQDHVNPNLLFLGTEYGVYISLNQGEEWHKFSKGMPTISVRDLAIQKRENDLVAATFGRSFYVLDDYSPLREITEEKLAQGAQLFPVKKALQYVETRGGTSSQGASFYTAENPTYGAQFTYYIAEDIKSIQAARVEGEKELKKTKKDIPFPGWEALDAEINEDKTSALLRITDSNGAFVAEVSGDYTKGVHRVSWDLRQTMSSAVDIESERSRGRGVQLFVPEGQYSVQLFKKHHGKLSELAQPRNFEVARIRKNVLDNPSAATHEAYAKNLNALLVRVSQMRKKFDTSTKKIKTLSRTLSYIEGKPQELHQLVYDLRKQQLALDKQLGGSPAKKEVGEKDTPTLSSRLSVASRGFYNNTYGPTNMHMESFDMAVNMVNSLSEKVDALAQRVDAVVKKAEAVGAPIVLD
ncbi:MAG: glycosyl hydrolase [Bacteroidetes bacterium]|nr:glycosyl hydrolase [Bacteroidota bacterium]MDA0887957.1 glycosyl hydrolase [Bacteroidota bacterium]MDA1083911.1 glycosyl hydrolase [Bacteroidota bacterium]